MKGKRNIISILMCSWVVVVGGHVVPQTCNQDVREWLSEQVRIYSWQFLAFRWRILYVGSSTALMEPFLCIVCKKCRLWQQDTVHSLLEVAFICYKLRWLCSPFLLTVVKCNQGLTSTRYPTRPDPNFFFATRTRSELFFIISEFRLFLSKLFPSRPLQIFWQ